MPPNRSAILDETLNLRRTATEGFIKTPMKTELGRYTLQLGYTLRYLKIWYKWLDIYDLVGG